MDVDQSPVGVVVVVTSDPSTRKTGAFAAPMWSYALTVDVDPMASQLTVAPS